VVGSLTKVLACPGLRIGYVLAPTATAALQIRARQPQWSVNAIAASALPDLLTFVDLPAWRDAIVRARGELVTMLASQGLAASAADAPWVLVAEAGLRDRLARHGVVVRDCSSFGLEHHVRIAVPDRSGLARLQEALCAVA
jgi:histidinol-phosphate/aromatic aminotransferase/cobyric acid decarboxylase-like protein